MIKKILKFLARLYMPVFQYESNTIKIYYAGYSEVKKNYFVKLILNKNNLRTYIGRRWFWEIPKLVKSYNPDFVVSETNRISLNYFQKHAGYLVPEWTQMRININRSMSEICRKNVSDFSDVARLIRKYNLTCEIFTDRESFNYFNQKMYIPYITKRHGNEALIEDLNILWDSSLSPYLLNIKENGVIVGASLIRKSGDILYLMRLGLLDGNEEYLRHGVIGAMYYFSIIEGQKMGCQYLNIGMTRPFLTNGLTKYKLGLSAEFVSDYSPHKEYLWFGVNKQSTAAMEFINSNPFMHLDKNNELVKNQL